MPNFKPDNLVLRCYGYRSGDDGFYVGVCIDLNIAVQADSVKELKRKMAEAIETYVNAVLDTEDKESIPALLSRCAPIRDRLVYHLIGFSIFVAKFRHRFVFEEFIPFHLAHNC